MEPVANNTMIDLTKEVKVYGIQAPSGDNDDRRPNALMFGSINETGSLVIPYKDEFEAYRQLFQEAPRTKREHAKMLVCLKRLNERCDYIELMLRRRYPDEAGSLRQEVSVIKALIAEIEGEK